MAGGRPKQWPSLRGLDSAVVAADTVRFLIDRVRTAGDFLAPTISLAMAGVGRESEFEACRLGRVVVSLVAYAKVGGVDDAVVEGLLEELGRCLTFEPRTVSERPRSEPFLSVPSLAVVVLAVRGRLAMEAGCDLKAAEYAALLDLDASTIRRRGRKDPSFGCRRGANGALLVSCATAQTEMQRFK